MSRLTLYGSIAVAAVVPQLAACQAASDDRPSVTIPGREVQVPDPCALIGDSLARDLVEATSGQRRPAEPDHAECLWSAPYTTDLSRKTGSVGVQAIVRRVYVPVSDPYLGAKSAYDAATRVHQCKPFSSGATQSCWAFTTSSGTLWVALRHGHLVFLIHCDGHNIPAIAPQHRAATATRLATEVMSNLRERS
ncbi:hypothetical protein [Thermomonospora umbrina]|nr:hypothetical protein [Thermomonospora umbrina]